MRTYYSVPGTRELIERASTYTSGAALDLGAGRAKYKDIMLRTCESCVTHDVAAYPGIDVVSDIEQTPLPDKSFDTIYCLQVFEHIPHPWIAVQEIDRLIRSGGVVVLTAPFLQASHADPGDYFRYTVQGLESFFPSDSYELLESGTYGGLFSLLVDFVRMRFFNVYEKPKRFSWRIIRGMVAAGLWLDKHFARKNKIIYMNSYVIARKK